ncbi:MAG: hypothetical protein AKCLJLPJ_02441 [Fimbriimonadales bacterium]|nr:hypothetical protein [Fimbriimonadales bacterium]
MAWAFAFAFASGQGRSQETALDDLRAGVGFAAAWMQTNGLKWDFDGGSLETNPESQFEVVERVESDGELAVGDTTGLFDWDKHALSSTDLDKIGRFLQASRGALLESAAAASEGIEGVAETLRHVAQAEWWYASRIPGSPADRLAPDASQDPLALLDECRSMLLENPDQRRCFLEMNDVYECDGELWTPRKVFRRALWHELYHLKQLMRLGHERAYDSRASAG